MALKKYKPITPGLRHRMANDNTEVTASSPERALTKGRNRIGGRNRTGKMTMRHRGGGHKRKYRVIDFKRNKDNIPAKVKSIEYDPNRSAYIALLAYADGEKRYIIAPVGMKVGDEVMSGSKAPVQDGNALFLKDIPLGTSVYAIEMQPGKGAQLVRSAGTSATLISKEGKYVVLKLPSGEIRRILASCKATLGSTSNPVHSNVVMGKAGRNRWKGRRPRTRGVAMNPVDHPMGGGEGRASGGHPRSRTGVMAKGQKTRSPKKKSNNLIISRKKK
ncbi:50S ribosomal protein L2 [Membranicola marinus]|uniref:Large ribosomal subunit protein uL2 n=1 Tax=Membranihabitans marinus TaxID=1227546 RepID=A0A953HR07_9BACT|nr:50S ribosomal protein L2 [Membranihabitans marinus]MBY5959303.1 50S ribosomal protein L2 [Membranihabitans marinus]